MGFYSLDSFLGLAASLVTALTFTNISKVQCVQQVNSVSLHAASFDGKSQQDGMERYGLFLEFVDRCRCWGGRCIPPDTMSSVQGKIITGLHHIEGANILVQRF